MEQNVSLAFENINSTDLSANAAGYGVDHVKVAEGLGCKAIRVEDPNDLAASFGKAKALMGEFQVPVVVEVILEKVTNISMGTEINAINEFEELAETREDAPTAILALQR
jgi:tartronate-semialdehyde synthase